MCSWPADRIDALMRQLIHRAAASATWGTQGGSLRYVGLQPPLHGVAAFAPWDCSLLCHVGRRPAQRADTFLEAQQALVDLSAIEPVAAVVALRLGSPFRAGEVDEAELALHLPLLPGVLGHQGHSQLQDGMRTRRDLVLASGLGGALGARKHLQQLLGSGDLNLLQPDHLLQAVLVLHYLDLLLLIEQVGALAAVDLEEARAHDVRYPLPRRVGQAAKDRVSHMAVQALRIAAPVGRP